MFDFRAYNDQFLDVRSYDTQYDVGVEQIITPADVNYECIGIHHLFPSENKGRHHIYVDVLDERGFRLDNAHILLGWTWEGRRPGESAPLIPFDKPASEPFTNLPMQSNQTISIWVHGDHPSNVATGMHTRHGDELGPNGQIWNSYGHHSFYVVFQKLPFRDVPKPPEGCVDSQEALARALKLEELVRELSTEVTDLIQWITEEE